MQPGDHGPQATSLSTAGARHWDRGTPRRCAALLAYALAVGGCTGGSDEPPPSSVAFPTPPSRPATSATTSTSQVIVGSGTPASQVREVGSFTGVVLDLPADVEVRVGQPPSVTLRADDNILGAITTDVANGALVIGTTASFSTESEITVEVLTPSLERVEVRGSGSVRASDVSSPVLEASIRGSGSVQASGTVERLVVTSAGSGSAALFELSAEEADVTVDGSGNVEVTVSRSLRAAVRGSGTVVYDGDPSEVVTDIDGSGAIPPR